MPTPDRNREESCRWAYVKAMRVAAIRDTFRARGRAVYLDMHGLNGLTSSPDRYVLSRVDLHERGGAVRSMTYCNGVCVAEG